MATDYSSLPDMCNTPVDHQNQTKSEPEQTPADSPIGEPQKPVIKAAVRKKSFGKKILGVFIADDIPDIKKHIVDDLLVPSIKNAVVNAVKDSIDMAVYGQVKSKSSGGKTSYSSFYDEKPKASIARQTHIEPAEVVFDTKADADIALDTLNDYIQRYRKVSCADFYEVSGVRGNGHTDENYGWYDLRDARVVNYRGDWIIDMPRAVDIRR